MDGGYLGDFTRSELQTFYIRHGLDFDIDDFEGTTRQRFIDILLRARGDAQARILRGVVDRSDGQAGPPTRTPELRSWVLHLADRCDSNAVATVVLADASASVSRALADAATLLETADATSALDRVHTALHGYLLDVCSRADLEPNSADPSIGALWALIRAGHPAFKQGGPRQSDVVKSSERWRQSWTY